MKNLITIAILGASALGISAVTKPLAISKANNAFGVDLLQKVAKDTGKNQMISPVSAFVALSMLHAGSEQNTKAQIAKALHVDQMSIEDLNAANSELLRALSAAKTVKTEIANSLWVNEPFGSVNQDYESMLSINYRAVIRSEDFKDPETVNQINHWASTKTHGKISKLIDKLSPAFTDQASAYLFNATYFKGDWESRFTANPSITNFKKADGSRVNASFMSRENHMGYAKQDGVEAVKLSYKEIASNGIEGVSSYNMLLILPEQGKTLESVVQDLNGEKLASLNAAVINNANAYGSLTMPKFSFSANYQLPEALQTLGIVDAFDQDFSMLTKILVKDGAPLRLKIADAFQNTYIHVDEIGTEAAAVTGIGVVSAGATPAKQFEMVADRPFLITIQDDTTGAVLFLGTVNDPASAN